MKKIIAIVGGASVLVVGALCTIGAIRRKAQKNLVAKVKSRKGVKRTKPKPKTRKNGQISQPDNTPATAHAE
jgi:hypothetical protein